MFVSHSIFNPGVILPLIDPLWQRGWRPIVTDATGITRHAIVKAVIAEPSIWTKIYTLSRR
jgi:hypothetical protein